MRDQKTTLLSYPKHAQDMRMLFDRILEPSTAHPLVRDLLESLRSCKFGEAQFSLTTIKRELEVDHPTIQRELSHLLFANALHSPSPFIGFQYLVDCGFDPSACATDLMEHIALGDYFVDRPHAIALLKWLSDKGGMVKPEARAAWKALQEHYPEAFEQNHSSYEAQKLEAYIRSQSLEVREVARL